MKHLSVEIRADYIAILDGPENEIVGWSKDEWEEDPENVIPAIGNAMVLAYNNPKKLIELLKPGK